MMFGGRSESGAAFTVRGGSVTIGDKVFLTAASDCGCCYEVSAVSKTKDLQVAEATIQGDPARYVEEVTVEA